MLLAMRSVAKTGQVSLFVLDDSSRIDEREEKSYVGCLWSCDLSILSECNTFAYSSKTKQCEMYTCDSEELCKIKATEDTKIAILVPLTTTVTAGVSGGGEEKTMTSEWGDTLEVWSILQFSTRSGAVASAATWQSLPSGGTCTIAT